MTDIPVTAKEFEAWLSPQEAIMPPELFALGRTAQSHIFKLNNNPPSRIRQMPEWQPQLWATMMSDLMAFVKACGEWKANRGTL